MKIKNLEKFLAVSSVVLMTACGSMPNKAPVIERGAAPAPATETVVVPAGKPAVKADASKGTYVVKRGDTLYRIALDHGQSYSDLVTWNSLKNPNDIKVDQVLRVAPPDLNGVQSVPVAAGALEVKPLPLPASNSLGNKNSPKGDKKPYSEANLAELQKQDVSSAASAPVGRPEVAAPAKVAEKATDTPATDGDAVDWMWPVDGKLLAGFDESKNKGLDIAGRMGQDIFSAGAGKVMYAGSGIRGYGNLVIVKHNNSLLSAYAHTKTILVKEGQSVTRGQKIAEMGNSDSDSVKLHFEIRLQGKPVDPARYLPAR